MGGEGNRGGAPFTGNWEPADKNHNSVRAMGGGNTSSFLPVIEKKGGTRKGGTKTKKRFGTVEEVGEKN